MNLNFLSVGGSETILQNVDSVITTQKFRSHNY